MELSGQLAVITGAADGIGAVIATTLAMAGADIVAVDIKPIDVDWLLKHRFHPGQRSAAYQCDVTSSAEVADVCARLLTDWGPVSILVNNAGGGGNESADDIATLTDAIWDDVLSLSLSSAMRFCRGLAGTMRERRYGRIINMSSTLKDGVFGTVGTLRGRLPYVTAKSALVGFTLQLAKDLGPHGISVNAVAPGLTLPGPEARITQRYNALAPEERQRLTGHIPAGRPATGEDVANAVRFLAAPGSAYVSGQILSVAGGA